MKQVRNFIVERAVALPRLMALIGLILLALSAIVYADERSVKITDLKASDGSKVEVVEELKVLAQTWGAIKAQ